MLFKEEMLSQYKDNAEELKKEQKQLQEEVYNLNKINDNLQKETEKQVQLMQQEIENQLSQKEDLENLIDQGKIKLEQLSQ